MKIFKYIFSLLIISGLVMSCSDDDLTILDGDLSAPQLSSSAGTNFVLQSDEANMEALTLSWNEVNMSVSTPVDYILQMATGGTDFAEVKTLQSSGATSYSMTVRQLNSRAIDAGIEPEESGSLDVRVIARIGSGNALNLVSETLTLNVTTYTDQLDLTTNWGVVGDATPNGWDGPDIPFWQTGESNVFVAYAGLNDGEIKFREDNSWDVNFGGENGQMIQDGPNIEVTAGKYKITIDFNEMTYSIEAFSLGVVGDATPNGWDGPDVELNFDPTSAKFRGVTALGDGEIKFRLNNDWGTNWGGNDGTLEQDGPNIVVSAGKYVISFDFGNNTYELEAIDNLWGLVGDATPNGWDGPDVQLNIDYTSEYASGQGVWYANGVNLNPGEVKFRADNDWGYNFGGSDGNLEQDGPNIAIESAGSYNVVFDMGNMTYSITPGN